MTTTDTYYNLTLTSTLIIDRHKSLHKMFFQKIDFGYIEFDFDKDCNQITSSGDNIINSIGILFLL